MYRFKIQIDRVRARQRERKIDRQRESEMMKINEKFRKIKVYTKKNDK